LTCYTYDPETQTVADATKQMTAISAGPSVEPCSL
jgi:hypothetical protein